VPTLAKVTLVVWLVGELNLTVSQVLLSSCHW
jgi:hypothetical protein